MTGACIYLLHDGSKGKIDVSWKASQGMMKDVNAFLDTLLNYKARIDSGSVPKKNFVCVFRIPARAPCARLPVSPS